MNADAQQERNAGDTVNHKSSNPHGNLPSGLLPSRSLLRTYIAARWISVTQRTDARPECLKEEASRIRSHLLRRGLYARAQNSCCSLLAAADAVGHADAVVGITGDSESWDLGDALLDASHAGDVS